MQNFNENKHLLSELSALQNIYKTSKNYAKKKFKKIYTTLTTLQLNLATHNLQRSCIFILEQGTRTKDRKTAPLRSDDLQPRGTHADPRP